MPLIITSDMYLLEHLACTSINPGSLNKLLKYTAPKPATPFEKSNVLSTPLMKMDGTENDCGSEITKTDVI